MGPSRFELETSRLSAGRSNQPKPRARTERGYSFPYPYLRFFLHNQHVQCATTNTLGPTWMCPGKERGFTRC